jgi:integrase/recombinase XerD
MTRGQVGPLFFVRDTSASVAASPACGVCPRHARSSHLFRRTLASQIFICYITKVMKEENPGKASREALLAELEGIRDVYKLDVKQFIGFVREKKLLLVEGFKQYVQWLDEEHDGKRYSPSTINRKIAAARSRVRYAFKQSAHAGSLGRKHHLEDILKAVKLKKVDLAAVPAEKVLDIEEARKLAGQAKDATIKLMVTFLVSTGVRVSEMLGIALTDLKTAKGALVQIRVRGKGAKERTIYVKQELVDRIRTHFHGTALLFEHGGRRYSRISVTNRIKYESLRILAREVTPQQLRHTWAVIQINRGRSVAAVAAILGHSDPGITARMYDNSTLKPEETFLDLEKMDDDGGHPA